MTLNDLIDFAEKNDLDFDKEISIMTHCGTDLGIECGLSSVGVKHDEIAIHIDVDLEQMADASNSDECPVCGG